MMFSMRLLMEDVVMGTISLPFVPAAGDRVVVAAHAGAGDVVYLVRLRTAVVFPDGEYKIGLHVSLLRTGIGLSGGS